MKFFKSRLTLVALAIVIFGLVVVGTWRGYTPQAAHAAQPSSSHYTLNCTTSSFCSEVWDSEQIFGEGKYVGHDEPSTLFYSTTPGSGNQMQYRLTLPKDPPPAPLIDRKSFNFQLHPAFWFGMAMCDTQSFPEQVSTCAPDTDKNIVDPAVSAKHPGTAFMEMQFYPPGWISWPAGNSCDATKWCAALNIDSLSVNPVTGQSQNSTCQGIAGLEYVNFAFITKSGKPQPHSPANPVHSTLQTFTPNPQADLFMNSGDQLTVTMHDTANGLNIAIKDLSSGAHGSMTTSAANTFGQVQFDPNGTSCNNIPYNFHPMYSTSSEKTRVPWAAHSYNIAFSDEIGHFDFCNGKNAITPGGSCPTGNTEGRGVDSEPTDTDDAFCFPASSSLLVQVSGCFASNTGFDGSSYQVDWPDGRPNHPTSILFSSPLTGNSFNVNYQRFAFEADLPRIEDPTVCDRFTGVGCTLIPTTDDPGPSGAPQPAVFYPFFSISGGQNGCVWRLGNHMPASSNDFGQNAQYGTLLNLTYTGLGGAPTTRYNDFRQIFNSNPCPA